MYIYNVLCKCIYVHVFLFMYTCMHGTMYVYVCTRIGICRWVLSFMFNVYLFVCVCVSSFACTCVSIHEVCNVCMSK